MLGVDSASVVVLKLFGGMDSARNGTVEVEFGLHLISTVEAVVVSDVVLGVLDSPAVLESVLSFGRRRPGAISADVQVRAGTLEVVGGILFARRMWDTDVVGVPVDTAGVSTVTGATFLAVDDNLGVQGDGAIRHEVVQDLEPVSDSGSRSLSPA